MRVRDDVTSVEAAVQKQLDSWQLFDSALRDPESVVYITQTE